MRLEERLRPVCDIDPAVARARLPSLLLQPLVENAIKYAVTPKEEGAGISVVAKPAGENVRIIVSDTGPGLNEAEVRQMLSTAVGVANIRDRLVQAFGERQNLETPSTPGRGCAVIVHMQPLTAEKKK